MSDTFKYLSKTGTEDEPAQEFLKKYTDRYTPEQQARLDANGGPSTANQTKYNPVVTNQDAIDDFNNAPSTATSAWDGENYTQNSMNSDDLKNHFGLVDGSDVGSGFNKASGATDGNQTKGNALLGEGYLTDENYEKLRNSDKVWDAYAAMEGQEAADEKREGNPDGLSINALDGLFDNLTANADPKGEAPKAIKEDVPIEYSPEIQQAQERVSTYQNDIMSGKTTDDIFSNPLDKLAPSFDATKGAAGIGTPKSGDSDQKATEATDSFLQSKKFDIKQKYNFQAQT